MSNEIARTQPGDYIKMLDGLMATGMLWFGLNEGNLRSLIDDPPKWVLESSSPALGAWSARYVLKNGAAKELALIQFKKDERTRGRDDVLWGEWTVHLYGPIDTATYGPNDDGARLVFLALHDYVWIKGLSPTPYPKPPIVELPPPVEPAPIDEWLLPENQAKHEHEIARIQAEVSPMPLDKDRVDAYMAGRNRNLGEVHDDEVNRADPKNEHGESIDPCGGVNRIPL